MLKDHISIAILKELRKITKLVKEQSEREARRSAIANRLLIDVVNRNDSDKGAK